eukprot:COSAG03_NODE_19677_length_332_cov_0.669528_1_plen_89_part_10
MWGVVVEQSATELYRALRPGDHRPRSSYLRSSSSPTQKTQASKCLRVPYVTRKEAGSSSPTQKTQASKCPKTPYGAGKEIGSSSPTQKT